jgi:hypothetical protein
VARSLAWRSALTQRYVRSSHLRKPRETKRPRRHFRRRDAASQDNDERARDNWRLFQELIRLRDEHSRCQAHDCRSAWLLLTG